MSLHLLAMHIRASLLLLPAIAIGRMSAGVYRALRVISLEGLRRNPYDVVVKDC